MNAHHRLTKARIAVSNQEMFLSSLVFRLIPREERSIPTTATDGTFLFFNPAFVDSVTDEELRGAVEHETYHCAFGYWMRQGGRDGSTWNKAHDYAINPLCKFKLLTGALLDPAFAGMAAERIYELLKRDPDQQRLRGCGTLLQPKGEDGKPASEQQLHDVAEGWELAVVQAANQARAAGKLPADVARIVDAMKKPEVNWRALLNRFMRERIRSDYSLLPPNRRYVHRGLFLHSIAEEDRMGTIVNVFDTSGSIYAYPDLLAQFLGEQRAIMQDVKPERTLLLECDAEIKRATEYAWDEFPDALELHGGGGTDFAPPFAYLEEQAITPECLIYFTDLEGSFPAEAPPYPVLWIVYGTCDTVPPFGEVVRIR